MSLFLMLLLQVALKLLPEIAKTTELQADATFDTLPGLFEQLFTLHISRFRGVGNSNLLKKKENIFTPFCLVWLLRRGGVSKVGKK